jgi:hypothetical protein
MTARQTYSAKLTPLPVAGNTANAVGTFSDLLAAAIIKIYEGIARYRDDYSDGFRGKANES